MSSTIGTWADRPARRFRLWLYLLIVFSVSWPFLILGALTARSVAESYAWNVTGMIMVTVGTFIAGRWVFRDGFRTVGWRWGSARAWALALGLTLLIWAVPAALDALRGNRTLAPFAWDNVWLTLAFVFFNPIPGFGEEFGWRGYLLPRQWRLGPRRAVLANSVIWWAWHLPITLLPVLVYAPAIAASQNISTELFLLVGVPIQAAAVFVAAVCAGIIFCYVWVRSGSIVVAAVFHGAYDAVRDTLALWLAGGSIVGGLLPVLIIVVLAPLLLWRGRWVLPAEDN